MSQNEDVEVFIQIRNGRVHMGKVKTLGIDLAKNTFQLHGVDGRGKKVLTKRLSRIELLAYIAELPRCLIAMEACIGSNYWAREFKELGHEVKIMAAQHVKPYIRGEKNDKNDARGIAEAATRPGMPSVVVKTIAQQDMQLLHGARELVVRQRVSLSNQIRGFLVEYGIVINKGVKAIRKNLLELIDSTAAGLTEIARGAFKQMLEQFKVLDEDEKRYSKQIEAMAEKDEVAKRLMEMDGVGPISATAFASAIGDGKSFKRGREVSAWLGLVPRQHSSGEKVKLGKMKRAGNSYLRRILIQGAQAALKVCDKKTDRHNEWMREKRDTRGNNKAAVALANKNARIMWALVTSGESYKRRAALAEQQCA